MWAAATHTGCGVSTSYLYGITVHHHKYDAAGVRCAAHAKVQQVVHQTWGQNQWLVINMGFTDTDKQLNQRKLLHRIFSSYLIWRQLNPISTKETRRLIFIVLFFWEFHSNQMHAVMQVWFSVLLNLTCRGIKQLRFFCIWQRWWDSEAEFTSSKHLIKHPASLS